jgi:hypothetical protein
MPPTPMSSTMLARPRNTHRSTASVVSACSRELMVLT